MSAVISALAVTACMAGCSDQGASADAAEAGAGGSQQDGVDDSGGSSGDADVAVLAGGEGGAVPGQANDSAGGTAGASDGAGGTETGDQGAAEGSAGSTPAGGSGPTEEPIWNSESRRIEVGCTGTFGGHCQNLGCPGPPDSWAADADELTADQIRILSSITPHQVQISPCDYPEYVFVIIDAAGNSQRYYAPNVMSGCVGNLELPADLVCEFFETL